MTDKLEVNTTTMSGKLVPFNPAFLNTSAFKGEKSVKPANWIVECDYATALKRLYEGAQVN